MTRIFLTITLLVFFAIPAKEAWSTVTLLDPNDIGLSQSRIALVIGNARYDNVSPLQNTINDARAVGNSLQKVGFRVYRVEDATRRELNDAIERFLDDIRPGAEALIYYAGHGVEVEGQNYLLPTDIRDLDPDQSRTLRADAISLTYLLEDVQSRKARVNLVILDACRDNPFTPRNNTRSLGRSAGLGRVDPPQGTVVIYAAAAGETALDKLDQFDSDPNGLFTRNLLKLIETPGLEIRPMVQELKERVYRTALSQADHVQRPSYYDGLIGKFYFLPESTSEPEPNACELLVDPNASTDKILYPDFRAVISACQTAIRNNPNEPRFGHLLKVAEEQRAAQKALISDVQLYSDAYLRLYPSGRFAADIRRHIAALGPSPDKDLIDDAPIRPNPPEAIDKDQPRPEEALTGKELAARIQTELNRVGCSAGRPDGIWGRGSRRAADQFNRHSKLQLASLEPTVDFLYRLRNFETRVCPLVCKVTENLVGNTCVAKTCSSGQRLSSRGKCYTPSQTSKKTKPASGSGGNCFMFNGERFCN
ncbi:hypothetical protein IWQ49_003922 [Labrenzia sp. EL_126]|nr:hypothetical protein [Labrenzia sp. EL_126]